MRLRSALVPLLTLGALMVAGAALAAGPGDLYVTSDATNKVTIFTGTTGILQGPFTVSNAAIGEMAIHFGLSNNRVLVGHGGGGVEEFDATTGAYIKTYNPGGGWQWAGLYGPGGVVLIGDMGTNDVRKYNPITGAFIGMLCPVPSPADMEIGPNGHLYICSFNGFVQEVDAVTGAIYNFINLPFGAQANDIAFLPNGELLITAMGTNVAYRFSPAITPLGTFVGTGWARPHGIAISPHTGRILVIDGTTTQVHEFDPVTFVELNANWLTPNPGLKIVDLAFRPAGVTSARESSWGALKRLYE